MKKKAIKLSTTHYIVVDDSEIKESDSIFNINTKEIIINWQGHGSMDWWKKITHSTKPLEGNRKYAVYQYNHHESRFNKIKPLSLSEIEEVIYGYNVEKMAKKFDNFYQDPEMFDEHESKQNIAIYKHGFKAQQELIKDKFILTAQELSDVIDKSFKIYKDSQKQYTDSDLARKNLKTELIQSLQKTEWDIELDEQGKIKLL